MKIFICFILLLESSILFSKENRSFKKNLGPLIVDSPVMIGTNSKKARENYNLGVDAFEKNDYKQAITHYKEAIRLDPNYVEALDNCGLTYRRLGDLKSAEYYYQQSIKVNPRTVTPHMNMAIIHTSRGEHEKALNKYKQVIEINPNDPEGYYGIAHVFLLQEKYVKALEASQKATALYAAYKPELISEGYASIGISYLGLKDIKKARKWIKMAIKEGSAVEPHVLEKAGLYAELGLMEMRAGNKEKGSQLIHKACQEKDLDGCFLEGLNFLEDNNLKEAGRLLKNVCDSGNLYGCYAFSIVENKNGNKKSASKYFAKSCSGPEKFEWCK